MSQTMSDLIAAARADQQRERAIASQALGVPVTDAGIEVPPLFLIGCPKVGCLYLYQAGGNGEGEVVRKLCRHIVAEHHSMEGQGR